MWGGGRRGGVREGEEGMLYPQLLSFLFLFSSRFFSLILSVPSSLS